MIRKYGKGELIKFSAGMVCNKLKTFALNKYFDTSERFQRHSSHSYKTFLVLLCHFMGVHP